MKPRRCSGSSFPTAKYVPPTSAIPITWPVAPSESAGSAATVHAAPSNRRIVGLIVAPAAPPATAIPAPTQMALSVPSVVGTSSIGPPRSDVAVDVEVGVVVGAAGVAEALGGAVVASGG